MMKDKMQSFGLLLLRLTFPLMLFFGHGMGKVNMLISGAWDKFPDPLGMGNMFALAGAAFAEGFCTLMVVLGLQTRIAAAFVVFTMLVAVLRVHTSDPFFAQMIHEQVQDFSMVMSPSKEFALLYACAFFALMFSGAGRFSLDGIMGKKKKDSLQK